MANKEANVNATENNGELIAEPIKAETTKEAIIRKLTSRKLWMSICSFVTLMLTAQGMPEQSVAQVAAIIMAGATVLAYVVAEGLTDAEGAGKTENGIAYVVDGTTEKNE